VALLNEAAGACREGKWDRAIEFYEQILQDPKYEKEESSWAIQTRAPGKSAQLTRRTHQCFGEHFWMMIAVKGVRNIGEGPPDP
jgi:hypothetical protein